MTNDIHDKLSAPFDVGELKFFPVAITKDGSKGRVGSYIDARAVMDRLDEVVGWEAWSTEYEVIDPAMKAVRCTLTVNGVSKTDVGYPNEGKDADNADKEPYKAAYSDALKRAAVQFGIGRYIYSLELEQDWLPVDQFKKFTQQPRLKGDRSPRSAEPPARVGEKPEGATPTPSGSGTTFPGSVMVNGDGTLNFTEFWAQCRKHNISREDVAAQVKGDLNNLKTMSASACVDVFNLLRDKQKEAVA